MKRNLLLLTFLLAVMIAAFPSASFALPEGVPGSLPAPAISNLELLKNDDGLPYYRAQVTVPASVLTLDQERPTGGWTNLEIDGKIDNQEWGTTGGGGGHLDVFTDAERAVPGKTNVFYINFDLEDEGGLTETVIKSRMYTYKVRFTYTYYYGDGPGEWTDVYSPWSNELASKSGSFFKGASSWAVPTLNKAQEYGFVTEKIKNNMSGKITREEFAEIVVKLYEKYTGEKATVGNASFIDTTNPEILKAANLNLVSGVGNNKFAPKMLVTREQMATILLRVVKVINPTADFSTAGAVPFADDAKIKNWAKDGVYYCGKTQIVKGVGKNMFDPEGNASREAAVVVCTNAYEYYK